MYMQVQSTAVRFLSNPCAMFEDSKIGSEKHDELERRDVTVAAAAAAADAQSKSVAKRHESAGSLDDPRRRKAEKQSRAYSAAPQPRNASAN